MVGLKGLWKLHWGPIREDLVYDFLRGLKNVDKMEIKAKGKNHQCNDF
jgi:hypothetical protein